MSSVVHSTMPLESIARTNANDPAEWGIVTRTLAAAAYLFAVGVAFTSIAGGILYLLG